MPGVLTIAAIGLGLSVDAFAAAMARGSQSRAERHSHVIRVGLLFGSFEALMPALGWLLGDLASDWIGAWSLWAAFALLTAVGLYMVVNGLTAHQSDPSAIEGSALAPTSYSRLSLTAMATSLDAGAAGAGFALLEMNIWLACLIVGCISGLAAAIGFVLGKSVGSRFGNYAEIGGGCVLIGASASLLLR